MLKNYTLVTTANEEATVCTAASSKELSVLSIMLNGGENGGEITLKIGTFDFSFSIAENDVVVLDNKLTLTSGQSLTVLATTAGIKVFVSAAELEG